MNGVLNIWVAPADDLSKAKTVTQEKVRPIPTHSWAYDNKHILYIQDKNGDENFHLYATNVVTGETKDLTPIDGVRAEIQEVSRKFPDEVLVGLNDRDKRFHDIWRINIATGEKKLVQQNPGVAGFLTDDDFRVRLAMNYTRTGGQVLQVPEKEQDGEVAKWKYFIEFGPEDAMTSGPAGFDKTGDTLYLQDSRNRNTAGLFAMDLESGHTKLIAEDPRTDVGGVLVHPTEKNIQAVSFTYGRTEWKVLDPAIAADIAYLKKFSDGDFLVTSRTLDDKQWTVAYILDTVLLSLIGFAFWEAIARTVGRPYWAGADGTLDHVTTMGLQLFLIGVSGVYFVGCWCGARRTIGMRLLGLRVERDDDGGALSVSQAAVRWLVLEGILSIVSVVMGPVDALYWVSFAVTWLWIIGLLVSTGRDPQRRGIHDKLSGSIVIAER